MLLGWSYNDSPEIGSLTDVDENEIAAMNPDTDLAQAIENNYTLKINERKLENAKNETVKNQLTTAIANNKKQIGASLSGAYKRCFQPRSLYSRPRQKHSWSRPIFPMQL